MDDGGSRNGVLLSEGAQCGGTVGRVPRWEPWKIC